MPPRLPAAVLLLAVAAAARGAPAGGDSGAARRPAPGALPDRVTVLYLADLGGFLEPCGCSVDQRGGLSRLATLVARIRAEGAPTFLVGGGDLLFDAPPEGEERAQAEEKAALVARLLREMGLAATLAGERDLFLGERFARDAGLPLTRGAVLGGLVAVGAPGEVPAAPVRIGLVHAGGTRAALPLAAAARTGGLALLLASHRAVLTDDDVDRAVLDAPVPVVQVAGRGQSLARIDLFLRGDLARGFAPAPGEEERRRALALLADREAGYRARLAAAGPGAAPLAAALAAKIAELEARAASLRARPVESPPADRPSLRITFLPVDARIAEDPPVRARIAAFYRRTGEENLARARRLGRRCPPAPAGAAVVVGVEACARCHAPAVAFWRRTGHATAYRTLAAGGRTGDLDCVRCHVTGWMAPGGACGVAGVAGREGVQCEACHGAGSLHAADPSRRVAREVPVARCRSCHTLEHSTGFDAESYRRRILGPGHGAR